jgi:hypothetical protein
LQDLGAEVVQRERTHLMTEEAVLMEGCHQQRGDEREGGDAEVDVS